LGSVGSVGTATEVCLDFGRSIGNTGLPPPELDSSKDPEERDPVRIITHGESAAFQIEAYTEDALDFLQEVHEPLP
jgi:hypothetical protein